jgi:hypothetical protein
VKLRQFEVICDVAWRHLVEMAKFGDLWRQDHHKITYGSGRTLHAFRLTFAVNYLRHGGSVFHLQKVLGPGTLEATRRYANLVTADLQAVHERSVCLGINYAGLRHSVE